MKTEYIGSITAVRAIEDCIRATKKYTKGAFRRSAQHPVQGEDFPSRVLTEYYEVYPDLTLGWDMNATDAWAWVWGDVTHIDVLFSYNYVKNRARVSIHGGNGTVTDLKKGIPGLKEALSGVAENGKH